MKYILPLLCSSIAAQFSNIGNSCNTWGHTCSNNVTPRPGTLVGSGYTQLGKSYTVTAQNAIVSCRNGPGLIFILTGVQECLLPIGNNCELYVIPLHWNIGGSQTFDIPNLPNLRGLVLYHQSYIIFSDGPYQWQFLYTSNALKVKIQ